MLTYSLHTNSSPHPRFDNRVGFNRGVAFVPQTALRSDRYSRSGEDGEQSRHVRPGPLSDLRNGETLIEGLPRSTLRDVKCKLAFVPAGHEYREWQEPRTRGRIVYFYFDPAKMPIDPGAGAADTPLAPRLFFEDKPLWETALKLGNLIESGSEDRHYCEALGVVLAHELVRRSAGMRRVEPPARGGLAAWQQRIVSAYIEEHIAEQVPLATLAHRVRLSPYHFCRAFKRSFGVPPHRYHNARRIDHAKTLLAQPARAATEIALKVGFSETSSFTAAFRKATGTTPTAYRRSLA